METGPDSDPHKTEIREAEPTTDIVTFRKVMTGVWHEEYTKAGVQESLEQQESNRDQELVTRGLTWSALANYEGRQRRQREKPEAHPLTELIIASGNPRKQQSAQEVASSEGINIRPYAEPAELERAEQATHARLKKQLLRERKKETNDPHLASSIAADYALEVAGQKAKHILEGNRDTPVLAFDLVVLHGDTILEKPTTKEEAESMLRRVAGGEIEISFGAVMQVPSSIGRVSTHETGRIRIAIRDLSDSDIEEYFASTGEAFKDIAGGVDWSDARAQGLLDHEKPAEVERLYLENGKSDEVQQATFSPELLPQMPDYLIGTPKELVQELVRRGKILSS
ncbi:MAG: Maf family protein [Patescibacteria group bacterium]